MPRKLSKKAVRRLTSLFIMASIVTGSFVPTAVVLAEEEILYSKEAEATETIANPEVNEEETDIVEESDPGVEAVENPEELDTEWIPEEGPLNGHLDAPLGVEKSEPPTGFGLDELMSFDEGAQSETILYSYVSNGTAFIYLDSSRTLDGEVAKLSDKSFHTVDLELHREMITSDITSLNSLNTVATNIKKLSIQFKETVPNKQILNNLQVRWCEDLSSNTTKIQTLILAQGHDTTLSKGNLKTVNMPNIIHIDPWAFEEQKFLKSVSFQNCETISYESFTNVIALEEVNAPNLKSVNNSSFTEARSLKKLSLPKLELVLLYKNDPRSFTNVIALEELSLPNATKIQGAFLNATSLKDVSLPNVTNLYEAFTNVTSLEDVSLPNVTFLSGEVFSNATSLKDVSLPNATTIINSYGVVFGTSAIEKLSLPNVTQLDNGSFRNAPLKELTIGIDNVGTQLSTDSLSSITTLNLTATETLESGLGTSLPSLQHLTSNATTAGKDAFLQANALETVTMPNVTSFGDNAFLQANALKTVTLPNVTSFGDNAFRLTPALKEVNLPSATVFGDSAFRNSAVSGALDLPQAKTFGPNSFTSATIRSIGLPSAEEIGELSFTNATIGVVDIPNATKISDIRSNDIGFVKFNKEISSAVSELPNSPNTIGIIQGATPEKHETSDGSFTLTQGDYLTNTSKLEKSSWGAELTNETTTLSSVGDLSFKNISADDSGEYNVSLWNENSKTLGKISTDWNTLTLENSVEVSDFQFEFHGEEGNSTATLIGYTGSDVEIEIPNEVVNTNAGWTEPSVVTAIGDRVFRNKGLVSVVLSNGATTIGSEAFSNNKLTSVTLPEGVTTIGNSAFYSNQLTSVTLPEGVTTIGNSAFYSNQLTSVTLPEGLTSIGIYTFMDNKLTSVTLPEGLTTIGGYAFRNNQLTSVTLPEGVTSIGNYAFENNQLTSVILPEGVTSIGIAAFNNNSLKKIEFMSNKVPTLGSSLFNDNAQLETIIAPKTSLTEYKGALTSGMFSLAESQTILLRSENNQVTYTDETQEVYTVIEGEDVTFGVDVSDAEMYRMTPTNKVWELEEPAFQWMKDGSPLGDQVNSSLSFTPTTVSDSGTYYVSVTHPALDQTQLSDIQLTVNATVVAGAPVTEQHVDENDQHLRQPRILRGNIGEKYTTCPGMFDGYRLKSTPDNASGTFTSDAQTVTYRYETLATPDAPHVNAVNDKDTMITGTGVVGATIKVMSEAQTLAVGQVETDGTYALPIVQQAAGTVLSVTQTLDGMESPSTSITVSKTEEVYTTKNEFKLGYWQSYGLILEGQLTNESWDVSSHEGLQGTVQLVNENGAVECSSPMMMTNWYDETQYNGYQAILDESMAATLSSGVYEIRMVVSQNGNVLANEAIGLPMMSRQMGLLMNFTSNFMSLPSNHIGSSFLEMKSKNQRAHIQIDTQEDTPIMGLISEAIIEEGRAINGFILNAPFDFSQEHQKNLIIETKTGEEVAVIEEVHTWDLSNWGLGVSHLDVHSGFQIIIPNDYTNTSLYQYKMTITAPGELETEHMRIALDKII